jgi:hypothetical protein
MPDRDFEEEGLLSHDDDPKGTFLDIGEMPE